MAEGGRCTSVGSLISYLEGQSSTSGRTPDPVYTTWFASVLERTAPMGVIEMPSAYNVTTTEGEWIEPPWWPFPPQGNTSHREPLPVERAHAPRTTRQELVVDALIRLGKDPLVIRTGTIEELPSTLLGSRVLWYNVEYWEELARSLPEDDLAALMRGIVVGENAGEWGCGSASPVIALHRVFRERFPDSEPELSRWIVGHRTNPYDPFGAIYPEATTWAELLARREEERADHEVKAREVKAAKVARLAQEATEQLWNAVRRGDLRAVDLMLSRGADWEKVVRQRGSLVSLAHEHGRGEVAKLLVERGVR